MTDEEHHTLGPYLLGGLTPAERKVFEAHLSECEQCRAELVASAAIPALLARVPQACVAQPAPSRLPSLVAAAAAQRRAGVRRRKLLAGVAAVCLLSTGGAVGFAVCSTQTDGSVAGRSVPIVASSGSHLSGHIQLVDKSWGTALILTASGLPEQGSFTLRSDDDAGRPQQTAVWSATPNGRVTVTGASSIHPGAQTLLTVTAADGTVLAIATP